MTVSKKKRESQPWFRRLYLPAYRLSDAARYAEAHPNTVASWHYRGTPVLPGHERGKPLSYRQLIEDAFVSFFRRMGVKMGRIREARDYVAQIFAAEFPFAEYTFKTEGMHVLMEFNEFTPDSAFDQVIVADSDGQLAWESMLDDKFALFDYEYEIALRWHPAGRDSKVIVDPRISFGAPTVDGLPTWAIKGRHLAGESIKEIMEDFDIAEKAIFDALKFEKVELDELAAA